MTKSMRWSLSLFILCATLCNISVAFGQTTTDPVHLTIATLESIGYPETMRVKVDVRDGNGRVVSDLSAAAFSITEQETPVADMKIEQTADALRLAVVIDLSDALKPDIFKQISANAQKLLTTLYEPLDPSPPVPHALELMLVIPADLSVPPVPLWTSSVFSSTEGVIEAYEEGTGDKRPKKQTKLYEAMRQAIEGKDGWKPNTVIVLSDGQGNTAGLDGLPELVKQSNVKLHILEYASSTTVAPELNAIATGAGTEPIRRPSDEQITQLVTTLRQESGESLYTLSYRSPVAQTRTPSSSIAVAVGVHLPEGSASGATTYEPPPALWDESAIDSAPISATGYPTVTLQLIPMNAARRKPDHLLASSDMTIRIDGRLVTGTLTASTEATANEGSSPESIAIVVDMREPDMYKRINQARSFIEGLQQVVSTSGIISRVAMFVPGRRQPELETFSIDHGRLINSTVNNSLFQNSVDQVEDNVFITTVIAAIERVATDSEANQGPAHVVLFSNAAQPDGFYTDVLKHAREKQVAIHIVQTLTEEAQECGLDAPTEQRRYQILTEQTLGCYLGQGTEQQLKGLARAIADTRPVSHTMKVMSPLVADGSLRSLEVAIGENTESAQLNAQIDGPSVARRWPLVAIPVSVAGLLCVVFVWRGRNNGSRKQESSAPDSIQAGELAQSDSLSIQPPELPKQETVVVPVEPVAPILPDRSPALPSSPYVAPEQRQQMLAFLEQRGKLLVQQSSKPASHPPQHAANLMNRSAKDHDPWDET